MAVSFEHWPSASESYYASPEGPSYAAAYNIPVTPEYNAQQQLPLYDAVPQTYVRRML